MACRKEECTLLSASKAAEATIQSCALALLAMPPGKSTSITKSAYTYASAAANVVVDEAFVADASAVLFGGVLVVVDPVTVVVLERVCDEVEGAADAVLVPSVVDVHVDMLLVAKVAVPFVRAIVQVVLVDVVAVRFWSALTAAEAEDVGVCEEAGGAVVAVLVQVEVGVCVDKVEVVKVGVLFDGGTAVDEGFRAACVVMPLLLGAALKVAEVDVTANVNVVLVLLAVVVDVFLPASVVVVALMAVLVLDCGGRVAVLVIVPLKVEIKVVKLLVVMVAMPFEGKAAVHEAF